MGILLVIIGLGWLFFKIMKEEFFTRQVPPNTDYRQALIDSTKHNLSGKELNRRLTNGYYVKKDNKKK